MHKTDDATTSKRDPKPSAPSSQLFVATFSAVLLFLSACGLMYWQFVSSQTPYLEERNFRALATSSHPLAQLISNYEKVFKSIVEGEPRIPRSVTSTIRHIFSIAQYDKKRQGRRLLNRLAPAITNV